MKKTSPLLVLLGLAISLIGFLPLANAPSSTGLIDGVGTPIACDGSDPFVGSGCFSESLTTAKGHNIIIVVIECGYTSCSSTSPPSITDTNRLSYTLRANYSPSVRLWEYYAQSATPLHSDIITVRMDTYFVMQAFAVHSANGRSLFDSRPAFPVKVPCAGRGGVECSAIVPVTKRELVFASVAINDDQGCTVPSTFSHLANGLGGSLDLDYSIVSSSRQGSNIVFNCDQSDPIAIMVDAIPIAGP